MAQVASSTTFGIPEYACRRLHILNTCILARKTCSEMEYLPVFGKLILVFFSVLLPLFLAFLLASGNAWLSCDGDALCMTCEI